MLFRRAKTKSLEGPFLEKAIRFYLEILYFVYVFDMIQSKVEKIIYSSILVAVCLTNSRALGFVVKELQNLK